MHVILGISCWLSTSLLVSTELIHIFYLTHRYIFMVVLSIIHDIWFYEWIVLSDLVSFLQKHVVWHCDVEIFCDFNFYWKHHLMEDHVLTYTPFLPLALKLFWSTGTYILPGNSPYGLDLWYLYRCLKLQWPLSSWNSKYRDIKTVEMSKVIQNFDLHF